MADTGWLNLTTYSNDASIGTEAWSTPTNAATEDGTMALCGTGPVAAISNYLKGLQLVSPPAGLSGSTINGIEVQINRKDTGNNNFDSTVKLVKGGTVSGDNKATATNWDNFVLAFENHGGPSDLWGLSLTSSDVLASNFGVVLSTKADVSNNLLSYVDVMQMRITYTPGSPSKMLLMFN